MRARLIGLLAETPIHVGAGQSTGAIDLPVAREGATDYPVIPGSGLKGALRDAARSNGPDLDDLNRTFGERDAAGQLVVSDARLLLLPVRSLTGTYRWATCPHLIERLGRDLERAGQGGWPDAMKVDRDEYLGTGPDVLTLEERQFTRRADLPDGLAARVRGFVPHDIAGQRLESQLIVLNDDDFAWFARYALPVAARNQLDALTKTSENLWYEESVPADTLFTALLAERDDGIVDGVLELFVKSPYLQVGGNESVGQGVFAIAVPSRRGDEG